MATIIRGLPFFEHPTTTDVAGRRVAVKADQIVVWVSLSPAGVRTLPAGTPRFPAILDTGCNHNFVIGESHIAHWAGIDTKHLRKLAMVRLKGRKMPQVAAIVWLHSNRPGYRDELANRPPTRLETQPAVVVAPDSTAEARLPLLGLRALRWAKLAVHIDGHRCRVTIRRRSRFGLLR